MAALAGSAASAFSKPEEKENLIPESSLPMGGETKDTMDSGPHIQSAAPDSSTAALAGGVPLEKKRQAMVIDPVDAPQTGAETAADVPEPVKESIAESHESPEAAASAEAVKEKSAVEQELLKKIPTSEATGDSGVTPATQSSYYGLATGVPSTVEKSMQEAHASPEAAADSSVVAEKSAMESELLKKIPSSEEAGEPAPTIAAATSETAPSATTSEKVAGGAAAAVGAIGAVAAGKALGGEDAKDKDLVEPSSKDASTAVADPVEHSHEIPTSAAETSATSTGAVGTLGTDSSAAAAVADGTDTADAPDAPKTSVPLEKTEGDAAEYAPVPATKTEPGVSAAAAAAVSDGTEDPTLADEPAVKMMQQDESNGAGETPAPQEGHTSAYNAVTSSAPATTETPATTEAPVTSDEAVTAPISGAKDEKSNTLGPAGTGTMRTTPSASSTPVKKVAAADESTSSPASSANTKEKKKRNRLSRLYHKIID